MIGAIRQKLLEMDKSACESDSLIGQEKGKSVRLPASARRKAIKIKVDDGSHGLITDTERCDCLYFYQPSKSKRHAFLVELKGHNYSKALEQLKATKNHRNYAALIEVAKPCKELAVAIVSLTAKTNRPRKEEWENENNFRLRVIQLEDDATYDLSKLIKDDTVKVA